MSDKVRELRDMMMFGGLHTALVGQVPSGVSFIYHNMTARVGRVTRPLEEELYNRLIIPRFSDKELGEDH